MSQIASGKACNHQVSSFTLRIGPSWSENTFNRPISTLEKVREARREEAVVPEKVKRVCRFGIREQPSFKLKLQMPADTPLGLHQPRRRPCFAVDDRTTENGRVLRIVQLNVFSDRRGQKTRSTDRFQP